MKLNFNLTKVSLIVVLLLGVTVKAQDIKLEFSDARQTSPDGGVTVYYEADILISSSTEFKLGSGQLYFNYNTEAFGENVSANGKLAFNHGANGGTYILDEYYSGSLPVYNNFVQNDNIKNRVSVSFGQALGSEGISVANVKTTPSKLMHIKMLYADPAQPANICFHSQAPFDNLFYTSCGGVSLDCQGAPALQITNDNFECANSEPELLSANDLDPNGITLKLYPNPSPTAFIIASTITSKMDVTLHDINGKLVNVVENYDGGSIDISQLQAGMYLVSIESEEGKTVKRLLIE